MAAASSPTKVTEKSEAIRIGRTNTELARRLDGRARTLFVVPKTPERGETDAANEVLLGLYDYDHDQSVVAVIDTEREAVVSVRETDAEFQLSDEERQEAERLAEQDPRVADILRGRKMNALTRLYFPENAASKHRHAIVFIRPTTSERWYAVVDLTSDTVIDVISRRELAGE
jgi:hypothetical protein